jgi:ribonucleoside-diphosphate reductase alpha chain
MKITRLYTREGESPYAGIDFVDQAYGVFDPKTGPRQARFTVPSTWSLEATGIIATKYARRAGVPSNVRFIDDGDGIPEQFWRATAAEDATFACETDARQVFHRLAGCWTYYGLKCGYFDSPADAAAYYDESVAMLALQIAAPNSPQFFNTGLGWAYGILGSKAGYYFTDHLTGEVHESPDLYTHPAPFACYIQSINDDLVNAGGIFDLVLREAAIFKVGGGSGSNFSALRGKGEHLSGGGTSSGLMSFLGVGDRAAGAIKSGGTTRRAAKMVIVDLDHPDVEEFIEWKPREERKVAALVAGSIALERSLNGILAAANAGGLADDARLNPKSNPKLNQAIRTALAAAVPQGMIQQILDLARQGVTEIKQETYDLGFEGEAYSTVAGQNSNNSIRIKNEFFPILDANGEWHLTRRLDGEIAKTVQAADLWSRIAYAAWECADPGLQFDTTMNEWHTIPQSGRINGTNPCSEYCSIDDSACNLASIRLTAFEKADGTFDHEKFAAVARLWTLTLEISVAAGQVPSAAIAGNTWRVRNLGLGYADLGALLMRWGIPYDSSEGFGWGAVIGAILTGSAYEASAEMAQQQGPFADFEANRDDMLRVIRNHARAAGLESELGDYESLSIKPVTHAPNLASAAAWTFAGNVWREALALGSVNGYRNSQVSVIAPTGTIGILLDCDTTGIEPDYALVKGKKLAGGGHMMLINHSVRNALSRLGYSETHIEQIHHFVRGTRTLAGAPHVNFETLLAKGLSQASLDLIEAALVASYTVSNAFTVLTITAADRAELGITDAIASKGEILSHLGFTRAQINEAQDVVLGRGTIEGAPHVRPEHLPIFDCAAPVGRSDRYIRPLAHVDMLAAVQPFISGAISKTVNMPASATIEDVKNVYRYAWEHMIKAVAVYRDGSKLSQPLSGMVDDSTEMGESSADFSSPLDVAERVVYRYIAQQRKLPSKRAAHIQKFVIGGMKFYLTTGDYPDGGLGEIFIAGDREGATLQALLNCFAKAVSMGLQHGVPLEEFVDSFTFTRFEPSGVVQDHDNLKLCTSVIDAFFRDLGLNYLGRRDLVQIKPEELAPPVDQRLDVVRETDSDGRYGRATRDTAASQNGHTNGSAQLHTNGSAQLHTNGSATPALVAVATTSAGAVAGALDVTTAKASGFTGECCRKCSSYRLVRRGTCSYCLDCDEAASGCS